MRPSHITVISKLLDLYVLFNKLGLKEIEQINATNYNIKIRSSPSKMLTYLCQKPFASNQPKCKLQEIDTPSKNFRPTELTRFHKINTTDVLQRAELDCLSAAINNWIRIVFRVPQINMDQYQSKPAGFCMPRNINSYQFMAVLMKIISASALLFASNPIGEWESLPIQAENVDIEVKHINQCGKGICNQQHSNTQLPS